MSRFLTTFKAELIRDPVWPWQRPIWRLLAPLEYQSDIAGPIEVPEGFETDLASVPWLPFAKFLAGGTANEPAVVHDYLCGSGFDRAKADRIIRESCQVIGMPLVGRTVIYAGARIGALVGIGSGDKG